MTQANDKFLLPSQCLLGLTVRLPTVTAFDRAPVLVGHTHFSCFIGAFHPDTYHPTFEPDPAKRSVITRLNLCIGRLMTANTRGAGNAGAGLFALRSFHNMKFSGTFVSFFL